MLSYHYTLSYIKREKDKKGGKTLHYLFPDFITFLRHHIAQIENQ